jgi:hypothetical protein
MFIQALSGSIYRGSEGERVAGGEWLTGGENVKKGLRAGQFTRTKSAPSREP